MKKKILILLTIILCSCAISANAEIFWSSVNVKGGDIGMVFGENITYNNVKISKLTDGRTSDTPSFVAFSKPDRHYSIYDGYNNKTTASWNSDSESKVNVIQGNDKSFKFEIPANFSEGIYVIEADGVRRYINAPYVKWVQGDVGEAATVGGWIRIMGEHLSNGNSAPKIVLADENGNLTDMTVSKVYDVNSVEVSVPQSLAVGTYDVYLHNGYGDDTAWSMPVKIEIKEPITKNANVYNVKDYGAVGDGNADDTLAVRKAIAQANINGGGTVYFPSGRYLFTGTFRIPQNTSIKGEAKELVSLVFLPFNWTIGNIPDAFFTGTKNFSIEDLTINGTRMNKCITSEFEKDNSENILIKNVNILANPFLFNGQGVGSVSILEGELGTYTNKTEAAIYLGGENITIEGCRVLGGKNSVMIYNANGVLIRNNEIYNGYMGFYTVSGSQNVIVEDNSISGQDLTSTGGGIANYDSNLSQNVYFARNKISKCFGNDREGMTTDGGRSAYYGTMSASLGTKIRLSSAPSWGDSGWTGAGLMILSGKGSGQYRLITGYSSNVVEINSPFAVNPDKESKIIIVSMNRNGIYVDNSFEDTGLMQFYGVGIDNIVTGNEFTRAAGIKLNAIYTYGGYRPSWYNDISYNHFKEGYYTHWFGTNDGLSGESSIWLNTAVYSQTPEQMMIAVNVSNNIFDNHSGIKITSENSSYPLTKDIIVQNNSIGNADIGMTIKEKIDGIVLKNNTFDNVTKEYNISVADVEYR